MKRLFVFLFTCAILCTICYTQASAHVGGGPPFLSVNGVYGVTNPYYFNDPTINIPQDYTGKTYLVNKPISFFVDTNQLLVPPDVAAASTFRWTMFEGSKDYKFGQKLEYTYTKPGSYIASLEVKAPGETSFFLIDTIQLDVLPNEKYKLPQVHMAVATNHRQSKKPILFQSTVSADPSTKVASTIWGFGDGATSTQQNVLHTYTNLQDYATIPVVFRVKDANNFSGYGGVILLANKGTLHFVDNLGKENPIPVQDTMPKTIPDNKTGNKKSSISLPIIIGSIVGIVVIGTLFILFKKKKQ